MLIVPLRMKEMSTQMKELAMDVLMPSLHLIIGCCLKLETVC